MHRKAGHTPHLRHVPAYLRDPSATAQELAAAGLDAVVAAQRQPKQKGPKAKRHKAAADPLKAAGGGGAAGGAGTRAGAAAAAAAAAAAPPAAAPGGGVFMRAAKGGSGIDQELTELEKRAMANPLKPSKARVLQGVGGPQLQAKLLGPKAAAALAAPKFNVRAVRPKMGAGAKRRR